MIKKLRSFTLIELLTVIAIIGILAGLITVGMSGPRKKTRDAKRKADLKTLQTATEMFYDANNRYPTAGAWGAPISIICAPAWCDDFRVDTEPYLATLPRDPQASGTGGNSGDYYYYASSGASSYILLSKLENTSDPDYKGKCLIPSSFTGTGVEYNYALPKWAPVTGADGKTYCF